MADVSVEIHKPGIQTTIQDYPGRVGYLAKGFFPAGPMDDVAFRAANALVGNQPGSPAIEVALGNVSFQPSSDVLAAVCGAKCAVSLDGQVADQWRTLRVAGGQELSLGIALGPGIRIYVAFGGFIDVPQVLGSRATYTIGGIGGIDGRALRAGDLIPLTDVHLDRRPMRVTPAALPLYEHEWTLEAIRGPQADPEYLTADDMDLFFSKAWNVSPQSSRTGIRLEPHRFQWARETGGVAGGHPSNILDDGYPVGGVNMNGDTPVILGPDGPTAGGFVVLATVIRGSLWKLGQLRPGRDTVRFREVGLQEALRLRAQVCGWPDESSLEILDD